MAQFYSAKQRVTTKQRITVTVDELDPFGQGVARHQGKTLFISGALPGEQAEVTLVEEKRQYARGKATRLLSLSPVVIPIPGASRPESIEDSVRAAGLELSQEELDAIGGIARVH